MTTNKWLVGWATIGNYLGKSAKTAIRYAKKDGLQFFRDLGGRPIAKPSMIDEYIVDLNKGSYHRGKRSYKDEGVDNAISYVEEKEKEQKDFDERFILSQRPPRSQF